MKTRVIILLSAIALVALCIAGQGIYIKYYILQPYGLDDGYKIMELPFQVLTDEGLQFAIELAEMMAQEPPDETEGTTGTLPSTGTTAPDPGTTPTTQPSVTDPNTPTGPSVPGTEPTEPIVPPTQPTPPPTEPPTSPTVPVIPDTYTYPGYDFSSTSVPDEWFDNVLFIGESRTVGLRDYARCGDADYFCGVGVTVFNVQKKSFADGKHFSEQTLESLLSSKTYDKVFINLGINECGYPAKTIIAAYKLLIELVQEKQPDATIILQSVLTVTKKYASTNSCFEPENLQALNEKIMALANNSSIYYIDANPYFTDPDGYLYTDITGDGCHFTGKYYKEWAKWIRYAVAQLDI